MTSKNPKLFMKSDKYPVFSKFQPGNSLIFEKLPTIQQKQQKYVSTVKSGPVNNMPSP
jgi:hypothetical protein